MLIKNRVYFVKQISWTHALRKIVINCYKYHGREDLLPAFSEEDEKANQLATLNSSVASTHVSLSKNSFCCHFKIFLIRKQIAGYHFSLSKRTFQANSINLTFYLKKKKFFVIFLNHLGLNHFIGWRIKSTQFRKCYKYNFQ